MLIFWAYITKYMYHSIGKVYLYAAAHICIVLQILEKSISRMHVLLMVVFQQSLIHRTVPCRNPWEFIITFDIVAEEGGALPVQHWHSTWEEL